MELQKQVTSLEISKRLKELGVKQESLFWWYSTNNGWMITAEPKKWMDEKTSAFTVAELGTILPKGVASRQLKKRGFSCWDNLTGQFKVWVSAKNAETEADARGLMLIHLLENKLI